MKSLSLPALAALLIPCLFSPAAGRDVGFRAVTMAGDFPGNEVFLHAPGSKHAGAKVAVKAFLNHESDTVSVETETLVITGQADPSSAGNRFAVLGEIKVPAAIKSGILLFVPGAKEGSGTVTLIEDHKTVFPPGSTVVLNTTKSDLLLEIEGGKFEVKAGARLVIRDQPVAENHHSSVKGFSRLDGKWVQFTSAMWPHPGAKRVIQLVTDNTRNGKAEIRGVRDISTPR